MEKGNRVNNRFRVNKLIIIVTFFLFIVLIARLCYLCLFDYKVGDSTISMFIKNRNTKEEVIMPERGTIYDINGNVLANDVASYTLIAYLSDKRVDANGNKLYVEDIDDTSEKLASVLGVESSVIKERLENGVNNNKYQIEFGSIGKGITELVKEQIDNLNLQGIDFIKDTKRYYPNGDFASYLLGYTVNKDDKEGNSWMTGEMGIEEYYNDLLSGTKGYVTYEKDKFGYKISNGREYSVPAEDGNNVYLTIDNNIQLFIENAVKAAQKESGAEWVFLGAMDAKTGAILGYSSTPSFDPNMRNMTSYTDPLVGLAYEPGSTMKIYSYMCAVESGNYNGNATYLSGTKSYESDRTDEIVTISDWNKKGWGYISYDSGFALSSNIAVANLVENVITKEDLKSCFSKYGFGNITNFTLKREVKGNTNYTYQIEAATAGYGQGVTTTPIQNMQALTIFANDGVMLKPYVVSKIVDTQTGKSVYDGKREEIGKVVSSDTVTKMKSLMASVVNGDNTNCTGYAYHMDGYSLIGKTGTAEIFNNKTGKYMTGASDYIYSFAGLFPEENPEIILYAAIKKPQEAINYVAPMIKEVEKNITKYLNIADTTRIKNEYEIESYANKNVSTIKSLLESKGLNVLVLGSGNKITNQYPSKGNLVNEDDLIVLKSDKLDNKMIDLSGYSYKEAINILELMGIKYEIEGSGYVYEQSIAAGEEVNDTLNLKLKSIY